MQLGKYRPLRENKYIGRKRKLSFRLYYGLTLILSGVVILVITLINKLF